MPLRFDLGPFEALHIGKCVLTNSHERAYFVVDGEAPILRARDHLAADKAQTPAEKLYRCVQQMYLEEASTKYQGEYLSLRVQAVEQSPDHYLAITAADKLVQAGNHYKALRELRTLVRADAFAVERSAPANYAPQWKRSSV